MLNLFTPQVPLGRCHPNFVAYLQRPQSQRDVLLGWSNGFVDRDGKFVVEFQTTFNSGFWELYVFACLKQMGFDVDFSVRTPDFVVCRNGEPLFCIEATTASNAAHATEEWDRDWLAAPRSGIRDIVNEATVRFANAVKAKHEKYLDTYARIPEIGKLPFVLAVSAFDQPFFFFEGFHPALRVLYGIDTLDVSADGFVPKPMLSITKRPTGAIVPLGCFREPRMPEISAVMFSNVATASKVTAVSADDPALEVQFWVRTMEGDGSTQSRNAVPKSDYHEELLDGLHFFHNPKAHYHFPPERFRFNGVAQWGFDSTRGIPLRIGSPRILLMRTSAGVVTKQRPRLTRDSARPDGTASYNGPVT